jgi:hypothetical protein
MLFKKQRRVLAAVAAAATALTLTSGPAIARLPEDASGPARATPRRSHVPLSCSPACARAPSRSVPTEVGRAIAFMPSSPGRARHRSLAGPTQHRGGPHALRRAAERWPVRVHRGRQQRVLARSSTRSPTMGLVCRSSRPSHAAGGWEANRGAVKHQPQTGLCWDAHNGRARACQLAQVHRNRSAQRPVSMHLLLGRHSKGIELLGRLCLR